MRNRKMKVLNRKSLTLAIPFFCAVLALMMVLAGCSSPSTSTPSTPPPTSTPSGTPTDQKPMEVVSLSGPVPPINPGGPTVELVLKNVSAEAVVSLSVTLEINRPFNLAFDVSLPVPVMAGKTITSRQNLIGGGFSDTVSYPLKISGVLRDGSTFNYVLQVQIKHYPPTTS